MSRDISAAARSGNGSIKAKVSMYIDIYKIPIQESSNGRTRAFDSRDAGSNPDS